MRKKLLNRISLKSYGFTLIELLVVVAIIAILAAMLLPALEKAREKARRSVCIQRMKEISKALEIYSLDWNEFYPPRVYDGYIFKHKYGPERKDDGLPILYYYGYIKNVQLFYCPNKEISMYGYDWNKMFFQGQPNDPNHYKFLGYVYIGNRLETSPPYWGHVVWFQKGTTVDGIYIVIPKGPAKFVIKRHKFGFSQSYLGTDWLSVSDSPFKLSPSEISILFDIVNIAPSNFTLDKADDEPVFSAHSRFKQVGEGGNVLYCDGHVEWKPLIINDIVKQKILTKTLTSSDLADPNVGKNGNWFRPSRLNTDGGNEVFYPISVP